MAEMSKDEAQALVNEDAALLRLAHNTVDEQAAMGNPLAMFLKPTFDKLHGDAARLVVFADLDVPGEGRGGVSTRSGGGGK
jgi:hypothetical protein